MSYVPLFDNADPHCFPLPPWPVQSPAAVLNFAGHVPGVGSRSSTRCSPLDFVEVATVVNNSKAQESGNGSSRESEAAAAAAAEGLAVLAAAGEKASAAAAAASSVVRAGPAAGVAGTGVGEGAAASEAEVASTVGESSASTPAAAAGAGVDVAAGKSSSNLSSREGDGKRLTQSKESGNAEGKPDVASVDKVKASASAKSVSGSSPAAPAPEGNPLNDVAANGTPPSSGAPSSSATDAGSAEADAVPTDPNKTAEAASVAASSAPPAATDARAAESTAPQGAVEGGTSTSTSTCSSTAEADAKKPAESDPAQTADVAMADMAPGTPTPPPDLKTEEVAAPSPDVTMSEAVPLSSNAADEKPATADNADTSQSEGEANTAAGGPAAAKAAGIVAPRGLVRRDGMSGSACKMCKTKWDRDQTLVCCSCLMHYHPGCLDPPMTPREVSGGGSGRQERGRRVCARTRVCPLESEKLRAPRWFLFR